MGDVPNYTPECEFVSTSICSCGRGSGETDGWTRRQMAISNEGPTSSQVYKLKESPLQPGTGLNLPGYRSVGQLAPTAPGRGRTRATAHGDPGREVTPALLSRSFEPQMQSAQLPTPYLKTKSIPTTSSQGLAGNPQAPAKSKCKSSFISKKEW